GMPRKILYHGNGCGLSDEVLGHPPGSRPALVYGRDLAVMRSGARSLLRPKAHQMHKYPSVKPAVWGAVAGAVAMSVIGFSQFGWTLGSSAERMANERAQTAVVTVLTPICVEKFRQQSEATAKLAEFSKATSWDQRSIIEKGGWATISGGETPNSAVVT